MIRDAADERAARLAWVLVAATPGLMALTTWHLGEPTPAIIFNNRFFAPAVLIAEIMVVGLAAWRGLRPAGALAAVKGSTRIALAALIALALGVAAFVAADGFMVAVRSATLLVHGAFGIAVGFLAGRAGIGVAAGRALAAGAVVYAVAATLFVVRADWADHDWLRFGLGVVNVRHVGFYLAVGIAAAIGVAAAAGGRGRIGWTLAAAGLALALAWAGSRGGIVACLGGAAIAAAVRRDRAIALLGLMVAALAAGAAASLPLPVPAPPYGLVRIGQSVTQGSDPSSGRMVLWRDTLHEVAKAPVIGHGEGQFFSTGAATPGQVHHPHQAVLQILFQWGAVGLLLVAFLAVRLWPAMVRGARSGDGALPVLTVAATLLVYSLYDGILFFVYPAMMLVGCCAALAGAGVASGAADRYLRRR